MSMALNAKNKLGFVMTHWSNHLQLIQMRMSSQGAMAW